MTERKIVIKTCEECPHRFKLMAQDYYPSYCNKNNLMIKIPKNYEIPDWCPLEENDK